MVPVYSGIEPAPYFSQVEMWRHIGHMEANGEYLVKPFVMGKRIAIRKARNTGCEKSLSEEATHLAMLDDDMIVRPNTLDILLAAKKPVVGSLCFTQEGNACSFVNDGNGGEKFDPNPPRSGLHQRAAIGSGFILIETAVLRELDSPWFYFDRTARTMDVNFCRDVYAAGFSVWCSSDAKIQQLNHQAFVSPEFGAQNADSAERESARDDRQRESGLSVVRTFDHQAPYKRVDPQPDCAETVERTG